MPASSAVHILTPRDPLPRNLPVPVLVHRCVDYRYPDRPIAVEEQLEPRRPTVSRAVTVPTVQLTAPQSAPLHQPLGWADKYAEDRRDIQRSHSMAELGSGWTRGVGSSRQVATYPVTNGDYDYEGAGNSGGNGHYRNHGGAGEYLGTQGGLGAHRGLHRSMSDVLVRDEFDYVEEEREERGEESGLFRMNEQGIWYMDPSGGSWT